MKELIAEVEAFLRAVRLPPRSPSVKCAADDDGPPWYRCPDCEIYWQPALNRGCQRVRGRAHQCWPTIMDVASAA